MKIVFPPASDFPPDFQKETVENILSTSCRGECIQLIGLPGSGKSILLSALASSPQILKFHLKEKSKNLCLVYLNLNLIPEKSTLSILKFILYHLLEKVEVENSLDNVVKSLISVVQERLNSPEKKIVFIFDAFDNLAQATLPDLFKILKGIRDQNRFRICYLFGVGKEISDQAKTSSLGDLSLLLLENLIYLPPLTTKDGLWFVNEWGKQLGQRIPKDDKMEILQISGGFMRTIKCLAQSINQGSSLKEINQNPTLNIHLAYCFERLLESLKPEKDTLKKLISDRIRPEDGKNLQTLKKLFIIDDKNTFTSPLFATFLRQKLDKKSPFSEKFAEKFLLEKLLTANEYKALKFLYGHTNEICPREEIITAVWGENASGETSDHALDQLLHRLRFKLASANRPVSLETIRARGHRLILS